MLEVEDFVDELNRNYHRVDGYSLKAKLAEARETRRNNSLLAIADDELVLGWRDSEWTGIAPVLEEDVASRRSRRTRSATRGRSTSCSPTMRTRSPSTAPRTSTAARSWSSCASCPTGHGRSRGGCLYEAADELRLEPLKASGDPAVAGLAAKIDREEAYHRMHAELWHDRLRDEPRFREAVAELWPFALGPVEPEQRPALAARFSLPEAEAVERGEHAEGWTELWDEMTEVRRSVPGATW